MEGSGKWIAGGAIGLVGILGLFLSAQAHDATFYWLGIGIFLVAMAVIFFMVKRQFDLSEGASH